MNTDCSEYKYVTDSVEVIVDVIDAWWLSFPPGCVVKCVARADHTGARLEGLRKAVWYRPEK